MISGVDANLFRSPNAVVNIVQLKSGMLISSDNSQNDSSDHRVEKFPYQVFVVIGLPLFIWLSFWNE